MGLAISELDGSAEGGVTAALAANSGLPAHMVGLGGTAADLRPFEARDLARGLVGLQRPPPARAPLGQGRASNTMLNGVSTATRIRPKPPSRTTASSRAGPACAPSAAPTSCAMEAGVQTIVEAA
jgi:hypothetical protein